MEGLDLLKNILGIGANYYAGAQGIEQAREIGREGYDLATQLGSDLASRGQFQPFTVTTSQGGITSTPQGGFTSTLSPELAAAEGRLRTKGMNLLDIASQPLEGRTQDILGSLQAARAPEQERQRMALEERLFNQGRTGVRTSQYGGTPEQLAMEKAMAEQASADAFTARQQAIQEQGQFAQLGRGLFSDSFTPQNQLLQSLAATTPLAQLASQANLQGGEWQSRLGQAGINSLLQGQTVASNLQQQQLQGIMNAVFGSPSNPQDDAIKAILESQGIDTSGIGGGSLLGSLFDFFGGQ